MVALQRAVPKGHASDALIDYVQAIIAYPRGATEYELGLSPRAGLALLRVARAWALIEGRDHVLPEDLQAVLPSVVGHRLSRPEELGASDSAEQLAAGLLREVPIP